MSTELYYDVSHETDNVAISSEAQPLDVNP